MRPIKERVRFAKSVVTARARLFLGVALAIIPHCYGVAAVFEFQSSLVAGSQVRRREVGLELPQAVLVAGAVTAVAFLESPCS